MATQKCPYCGEEYDPTYMVTPHKCKEMQIHEKEQQIKKLKKEIENLKKGELKSLDSTFSNKGSVRVEKGNPDKNPFAVTGFIFGIISIFLSAFSLFPILAIIFSGIGLSEARKGGRSSWMAIVGLVLGILYLLVSIGSKVYLER